MEDVQREEGAQARLWNGPAGRAWAETQELLDRMFAPFERLLVDEVRAGPGGRVLDVGCGSGACTLAIARALGTQGRCTGIDISAPMLAVARARAAREALPVRFVQADAQVHAFARAGFDAIVSRFGVMFFDDPVRAFANLRAAAAADAELGFVAWRGPGENPFMTTAERAVRPFLPELPARRPDTPGQFAFADRGRVRAILERAGWAGIDIRPLDVPCALPEPDLIGYLARLGPLGLLLPELDEALRARAIAAARAAFEPYVHGAQVRYMAACWSVRARAARGGPLSSSASASSRSPSAAPRPSGTRRSSPSGGG